MSRSGSVYAAGGTSAPDFPTTPSSYLANPPAGPTYAFVAEFGPGLSKVLADTLFGNPYAYCAAYAGCDVSTQTGATLAHTIANALAIDKAGTILYLR